MPYKAMAERPSYLTTKAGKYALGANRGPLAKEDIVESQIAHVELADSSSLKGRGKRVIDNASLVLVEAKIMQPRPESVLLSIQTALKLPVNVPVRLDPNVLHLFNNDEPGNSTYLKVYNDAIQIQGTASIGVQNQPSPVNPEPWKHYVRSVVFEPHAPLSAFGNTNIYLGRLKSHISLKKDLPQNRNATINNLTLRPGNHSTPLEGVVDMHTIIENLLPLVQAQGSSLRNGYLSLDAVTREVEYDGVVIPYYTEAMRDLVLSAKVPVNDLVINSIQGILHSNSSDLQSILSDTGDRNVTK
ncbi:hypothetical protein APSETT445_009080 [Aspergillus pseudonomiae]